MSENVLDMMVNSNFPVGLKAGVPSDVPVADKFGERQVFTPQGDNIKNELHDCGIVYFKSYPYFLCVMTQGQNIDDLKSVIKNISHLTYQNYINYK